VSTEQESLAKLLEAWRQSHSPEVADAIQSQSDQTLTDYKPPKPKPADTSSKWQSERALALRKAFHDSWKEAAKTGGPEATAWLVSTLTSKLPDIDPTGTALAERMRLLSKRMPDPRIAAALAQILIDMTYAHTYSTVMELVYGTAVRLLAESEDSRQVVVLERALAAPRARTADAREWLAKRLPKAIEKLRASGPVAAAKPAPRRSGDPQKLLEAIFANPDDDEVRLVYADALQEANDPRGEFIALQVQQARGTGSEAIAKRIAALLREHAAAWLGELAPVFVNPRFERGFLCRGELARNSAATAEVWKRAPNDPLVATLRELHQGNSNIANYLAFVSAPAVRWLKGVDVANEEVFDQIAALEKPLSIEHLDLRKLPSARLLERLGREPWNRIRSLGLQLRNAEDALPTLEKPLPRTVRSFAVRIVDGYFSSDDEGAILSRARAIGLDQVTLVEREHKTDLANTSSGLELRHVARSGPDASDLQLFRPALEGLKRARFVMSKDADEDELQEWRRALPKGCEVVVEVVSASEVASMILWYL
jgi:uncharacterized protein (TIGR02996 family)